MDKVFSVGSGVAADLYANEDQAYEIAIQYLRDPYWKNKIENTQDREVLKVLLESNSRLALDFYNRHVADKDAWIVQEHEVTGAEEHSARMIKAKEASVCRLS